MEIILTEVTSFFSVPLKKPSTSTLGTSHSMQQCNTWQSLTGYFGYRLSGSHHTE